MFQAQFQAPGTWQEPEHSSFSCGADVLAVVVVVGGVRQIINKYTNKFILLKDNL